MADRGWIKTMNVVWMRPLHWSEPVAIRREWYDLLRLCRKEYHKRRGMVWNAGNKWKKL